ncbi:unnamed protein product [Moneuplotes crassus]|uniref:Uncharacterized protein n=1 Tax=Euplotes crassus TaxID=5936 RepID=A0AAD2D482_EUPCR|nr:unnamed protein product [Moneuplotes crassus]
MNTRRTELVIRREEITAAAALLMPILQKEQFLTCLYLESTIILNLKMEYQMKAIKLIKGQKFNYFRTTCFVVENFEKITPRTFKLVVDSLISKVIKIVLVNNDSCRKRNLHKFIPSICKAIEGREGILNIHNFKISRKSLQRLITSARSLESISLNNCEVEFDGMKFHPRTNFQIKKIEISNCISKDRPDSEICPSDVDSLFTCINECSLSYCLDSLSVTYV